MTAFDWCIGVDTSGKETTRTTHDYRYRDGVWSCANCPKVKVKI